VAPYAHLSDGFIDLLYSKPLSRPKLTKLLLDIEEGKHVDMKDIEYHKVKAFILEPAAKDGVIMIDGERVPEEPTKVELHSSLVRLFVEPN
jgi:diacylglycerol kinase family enzyme